MQVDIYRNDLIFRNVQRPNSFMLLLKKNPRIKYRNVQGTFYISVGLIRETREALHEIRSQIIPSERYKKFANRFLVNTGPLVIEWHPSYCEMRGGDIPFSALIAETSFFNKAALNSHAYEIGRWDGNTHLFDVVTGKFPSGLLERILKVLVQHGENAQVIQRFTYPKPEFTWNPSFQFEPTADQVEAVAALDRSNTGIAKLPTGFGKTSFVAASLIAKKGVRSLFLANQRVLIHDAKKDFESTFQNQVTIGLIGDGEFDPQPITVASIQGIVAALTLPNKEELKAAENEVSITKSRLEYDETKENKTAYTKAKNKHEKMKNKILKYDQLKQFLKEVQLFIVDESQVLGTDMWDTFLDECPAPYRYTLSATDTRSDGGRIQIVAATGERRYESSAAEQIAKKRLAEFKAVFGKFDHQVPHDVLKNLQMDYHQAYEQFIVDNPLRNQHLCEKVMTYYKQGYAVIALVTVIRHTEIILDILQDMGMENSQMAIVTGQTPKKQRNDAIERFRSGQVPILIGSSIFDVGFNAKNAARMVRFNAGGSEIREAQRAGRTVRMRDDGSHGETYDLIDMNVPYFQAQAWKRIKLLRDEFGHERVVITQQLIKGTGSYGTLKQVATKRDPQLSLDEIVKDFKGQTKEDIEISPELISLLNEFS